MTQPQIQLYDEISHTFEILASRLVVTDKVSFQLCYDLNGKFLELVESFVDKRNDSQEPKAYTGFDL